MKSRTPKPVPSVEALLASIDHPFKPTILALRQLTLAADPAIAEEIKWNAPSFRTTEHFATMHLRAKDGAMMILHLGAKRRAPAGARSLIQDPESLLTWLDQDRASVTFASADAVTARGGAYTAIIRQWIQLL